MTEAIQKVESDVRELAKDFAALVTLPVFMVHWKTIAKCLRETADDIDVMLEENRKSKEPSEG